MSSNDRVPRQVVMTGPGASTPTALRVGVFELDRRTGQLRKAGILVHLPPQPFKILALLASRPGQLVTREEISQQVWGCETFVDFEQGLNHCIKQIRTVLGDDADTPRYVETLPRRGYRFIAPVETTQGSVSDQEAVHPLAPVGGAVLDKDTPHRKASTAAPVGVGSDPRARPPDGAHRRVLLRARWIAAGAGTSVVALAAGLALVMTVNVGGLRDRLATIAAERHPALCQGCHDAPRLVVPLPRIGSIAVLPLENLSSYPDQEYFADGMTEELITDLGKISALRVISRTSVMHYKGTAKTLPEIARELNVDAVVEGAVMRSGDRVRITAQLIQAATDKHLWAETYERDLRDVLALQDEVAQDITSEIQIELTPQQQAWFASARPVSPEAHEAYLMGRYYWNKRTEAGVKKAIVYFHIAIEKDPGYALAYAGLADAYVVLVPWEARATKEALPEARAAARKALQIDSTLAEAHATLGMSNLYDLDWLGAESEFKRAIELNASNATAHEWYSLTLASIGRWDKAMEEANRAQVLDPHSLVMRAVVGWVFLLSGQYQQAIGQEQKTLQMDPDFVPALLYLGLAYDQKERYQEATAALERANKLSGGSPFALAELARTYALSGQRGRAIEVFKELRGLSKRRYVPSFKIAVVYAALGQNGRAFTWLEKAYNDHDQGLSNVKVDPRLDPLRSDPRYQDLLRRMNFPP